MKLSAQIGEYAWYARRKYRAVSVKETPHEDKSCRYCDLRNSTVCKFITCTDMKRKEDFIWRLTPKYRKLKNNSKN